MICPHCGHEKNKVDRTEKDKTIIWRLRICTKCQWQWWTSESEDTPLWLRKQPDNEGVA